MRHAMHLGLVLLLSLPANLGTAAETSAPCDSGDAPRHVLMVLIDAVRPDHLGAYGYSRPTSPNFDRLAATGALFEECRSTSTWSKPALASLLSGFSPMIHGVEKGGLRETQEVRSLSLAFETLPEFLKRHGFSAITYTGTPHLSAATGLTQGFDHVARGAQFGPGLVNDFLRWLEPPAASSPPTVQPPSARTSPWFAYVHLMNPHLPYTSSDHHQRLFSAESYGDEEVPIPAAALAAVGGQAVRGTDDLRVYRARYDAAIHEADEGLGRIVGALRDQGLLEDTLILVTADHGQQFLERGGLSHAGQPFEELLRVPLLISYPRLVRQGIRVPGPVSLLDVYPTIADLLRLEPPAGLQGRSLRGALTGSDEKAPAGAFVTTHTPMSARNRLRTDVVVLDGLKLHVTRQPNGDTRNALFDLRSDPLEKVNLAGERPEDVERLLAVLEEMSRRADELRPVPSPTPVEIPDDPAVTLLLEALGYLEGPSGLDRASTGR